jgi:PhnB protein
MSVQLHPYLSFKDNARQAMEFYKEVFGGELTISTFEEYHASEDPAENNKVMHAMLNGDNGITFMASDTPNAMEFTAGHNISMSVSGDDDAALRTYWEKLTAEGTITMPLEKAPWGDTFGMVTDKFGIDWMIDIGPAQQ